MYFQGVFESKNISTEAFYMFRESLVQNTPSNKTEHVHIGDRKLIGDRENFLLLCKPNTCLLCRYETPPCLRNCNNTELCWTFWQFRYAGLASILYFVTSSLKTITLHLLFKLLSKVPYFWSVVSKIFFIFFSCPVGSQSLPVIYPNTNTICYPEEHTVISLKLLSII